MAIKREDLVGNTYKNLKGYKYIVTSYEGQGAYNISTYKVKFMDTGYETIAGSPNIKKGYIKDRLKRDNSGTGYLGEPVLPFNRKEYHRWCGMLARCYDPSNSSYVSYGGRGVTVSERWQCFETFIKDILDLPSYNPDYEMDKDIKIPGNKLYDVSTVTFVPSEVNIAAIHTELKHKPVIAIGKDGTEQYFESQRICAKALNIQYQNLNHCLRGKIKHVKGYTFRYAEKESVTTKLGS